ncbi:MAG TPA: response regulator transcription factor [Steroidobacteraceae bacterium]|nr:response regulator transcription factor [Steroidobacteraceae bacterium]
MTAPHLCVILVEDHGPLRDILLEYISELPQVSDCRAYPSAEAVLSRLEGADGVPDLMLIDLSLPGMSGIELVRALRSIHPRLRCAILSGHRSPAYVGQALAAGAMGYILKGDPLEIERGIDAMFHGERFVSADLTELR